MAIDYLNEFLPLVRWYLAHGTDIKVAEAERFQAAAEVRNRATVIRRIAGEVSPRQRVWRGTTSELEQAAEEALYLLHEQDRIEGVFATPAPQMSADGLHEAVWDAAASLWQTDHRRDAVRAAARAVNAQLQHRVGRRDAGEEQLCREAFSTEEPKPDQPRLRLMDDDGSKTFRAMHIGAGQFGAGCFIALRNPAAHEHDTDELPEQTALEQLAAFSILARWIDEARVVTS